MGKDKYNLLINGKIKPLIIVFAIPTIISMLVSAIYNFADTYYVSSLSHSVEAISAVGIVFFLMAIIQAIGYFFGHGSGTNIARLIGKQEIDKAKTYAANGFILSFACGIIVSIIGLIFLEPIAKALTANKNEYVYLYAKDYLFWILLGTPFMCSSNTLNNQLRYQGNAVLAMVGLTSGAVFNIFLDPIFIKDYGVYGAGISTFVSQILGFSLLFLATFFKGNITIQFKEFKFDKEVFKNITNGGFPSLARQGLNAISILVLNLVAIDYSLDAIAAMTIVNRIMSFAISLTLGIGQGFQPLCGVNYGAKKYERVKEGFFFTVMVATIALLFFTSICVFKGESIIKIFINEKSQFQNYEEFMKIAKELLIYQASAIVLFGFTTVSNMMMQTMGKSIRATILAIGRQALFFIPLLFLFRALWGFKGVELTQMSADILCFITAVFLTIGVFKELNQESRLRQ